MQGANMKIKLTTLRREEPASPAAEDMLSIRFTTAFRTALENTLYSKECTQWLVYRKKYIPFWKVFTTCLRLML